MISRRYDVNVNDLRIRNRCSHQTLEPLKFTDTCLKEDPRGFIVDLYRSTDEGSNMEHLKEKLNPIEYLIKITIILNDISFELNLWKRLKWRTTIQIIKKKLKWKNNF
jgi:hypothetical protein